MSRIGESFQELRRKGELGVIVYLPVGYPSVEATLELVPAVLEGGAHMVELGIPFSDPLADGATIQRATQVALEQGVTVERCLEVVGRLRGRGVEAPIVLMTYYNPVLAYGEEDFLVHSKKVGADGLIVVDLPWEEGENIREKSLRLGLDFIPLVAPTTQDDRIARMGREGRGFIYCVSVTGVTGARDELPPDLPQLLQRVRAYSPLPIAVGFGISKRKHLEAVRPFAEGVVIGSALIQTMEGAKREEAIARARRYVEVVTGRRAEAPHDDLF